MLSRLNLKSDFVKYLMILLSGTVIAQLFSYVLAPIITRLYTPEETGELGLFIRIIAVGAAIATARYELALPIAKTHAHSFRLYLIAIRIAVFVTIASFIILLVPIIQGSDSISFLFYLLVPVGIFFTVIYNVGTNWAIRRKFFTSISYTKVSNSLIGGLSKVGFGLLKLGYIGLIIGTLIGLIVSSIWFIRDYVKGKEEFGIHSKSPRNFLLAKEYQEFPKINLPHVIMDLGRDLLLAVIIREIFSKTDFGLYDHSYRMLRLPLILAGLAIGQIFFQKCAELINQKANVLPLLRKSVRTLTLLSILPFLIVFFFGDDMFAFVFGEKWRMAGTFAEIMTPWFMVNFISSPISSLPLTLRRQKSFFFLSVVGSALMILSVSVPFYFFEADIITTLWVMSIVNGAFQLFLIFKIFGFVKTFNRVNNLT